MKYKLTDEKMEWMGRTLYRIVAVDGCVGVVAGNFGGWIESERNLSQSGDAQVYGDARVFGNAQVYGYIAMMRAVFKIKED